MVGSGDSTGKSLDDCVEYLVVRYRPCALQIHEDSGKDAAGEYNDELHDEGACDLDDVDTGDVQ